MVDFKHDPEKKPDDIHLPKLPEQEFSFVVERVDQQVRLLINGQAYMLDKQTAHKLLDALMRKTPF